MLADRKVNRLQLKANCYADIQQATVLIEDALRTASFPGLPKNGVIVIRRLELGQLSMTNNSSNFSYRIDQRFLALQPTIITLGQEEQPDSSLVWFADTVEPYVLLCRLLAKDVVPSSWYWPLVVPDWRHKSNAGEGLMQVIDAAARQPLGASIVAAIMDRLVLDGTINDLMGSMQTAYAGYIVHTIFPQANCLQSINPEGDDPIVKPPALSKSWQITLYHWLPKWGMEDSRSVLLATCAAITHNYVTASFKIADILRQSSRPNHHHYQQSTSEDTISKEMEPAAHDSVVSEQKSKQQRVADEHLIQPQTFNDASENISENDEHNKAGWQEPFGVLSSYAGVPLLTNVLQQLNLQGTLAQFPLLAELNLPQRIFWQCIETAAIDKRDVICQWLTSEKALPSTSQHCPFVIPDAWLAQLFPQHRTNTVVVRRMKTNRDKHFLCDSSGKIVLAIWQRKMPDVVVNLIDGRRIHLLPPVQHAVDLELIVSTYLFAIKRYLRRYAKAGLRKTVTRPGYVAITRTHLDVSYAMEQIDFDIRKAGLDIDPGWVPWLGRVVQFHYLEKE